MQTASAALIDRGLLAPGELLGRLERLAAWCWRNRRAAAMSRLGKIVGKIDMDGIGESVYLADPPTERSALCFESTLPNW